MFRNLEAEITRAGLRKRDMASKLGCTRSTLSLKLNGKAPITLKEAVQIKKILDVDIPLEELFVEDCKNRNTQSA